MKFDETRDLTGKTACEKAGYLMMRYMDGELSEKETERLKEHVDGCPSCKEDLATYDFIREQLSLETGLLPAPEGFTRAVMKSVALLPSPKKIASAAFDRKMRVLWVTLSVLFGAAFLLVWYREPIMRSLSGVPAFSGYVGVLTPVASWLSDSISSFLSGVSGAALSAMSFISEYRYVFFAAFCVLCGSLFVITKKRSADKSRRGIQ